MNRKRISVVIEILLLVLVGGVSSPTVAQQNSKSISKQEISDFETGNPLFLVNIGDANLAVRYHKGEGTPILFVHGSWVDHNSWLPIADKLSGQVKNPIVLYDRRGHSASTPDTQQGSIIQDVNDVIALMENLGFEKANFVGHSYGSNIVILLATEHPEYVKNILVYEPPLFGVVKRKTEYKKDLMPVKKAMLSAKALLEKGEIEKGTIQFIERVAFGEGSWKNVFDKSERRIMLANYHTWLDQSKDPQRLNIQPEKLNSFNGHMTILYGASTLPVYKDVITELDKTLKNKHIIEVKNAGHAGLITNPDDVANAIKKEVEIEKGSKKKAKERFIK